MALVIEDGTGKGNANSYISVLDADNYHTLRWNDTWLTITNAQKEAAIIRGVDYIEQVYSQAWQGYRVSETQALSFPRTQVYLNGYLIGSTVVPQLLINATCELALKAASGELAEDLERGVVREKVGVIEVEYDKYSPERKRYVAVENMLKPLLASQSNMYVGLQRV